MKVGIVEDIAGLYDIWCGFSFFLMGLSVVVLCQRAAEMFVTVRLQLYLLPCCFRKASRPKSDRLREPCFCKAKGADMMDYRFKSDQLGWAQLQPEKNIFAMVEGDKKSFWNSKFPEMGSHASLPIELYVLLKCRPESFIPRELKKIKFSHQGGFSYKDVYKYQIRYHTMILIEEYYCINCTNDIM